MNKAVLEIQNLTFSYDNARKIFENFNLVIKPQQIISIVGPSGSGKSTLLELITKNQKPQQGSVKVENIAQIFQDPYTSFYHGYSVRRQIEEIVSIAPTHKGLLERLALDESLLDKFPYELSGGQLQRASIFRALLMKPKLLLADEPTSALDNINQFEIMKILVDSLEDFSILLITHDESLAKWCSDEIIYLEGKQ
jgi:peptide/nickel transport system ATP-binding protein